MEALTVEDLAGIIGDELERDSWGEIDPSLFDHIAAAEPIDDDEELRRDVDGMRAVLERVLARLKEGR